MFFLAANVTDTGSMIHAVGQVITDRAAEQAHQKDSDEPYDAVR